MEDEQGGLLDNCKLVDTLIVDCSDLQKTLVGGQYVLFCAILVQMVQKLSNLKQGIKDDMDSKERQIQHLRETIDELSAKLMTLHDEKGG